jgi:hypothetical protein
MPLRISKSGSTIATFKILNFDSDAQTFLTAAGITNSAQQNAINKLTIDLKYYGLWTKMKALYPVVGGTAASHKWNLKDPRDLDAAFRLTFTAGWVHSSTGMLPNGSSDYADTFLVPSTNLTPNMHLSYYSRTNIAQQTIDIGSSQVIVSPPNTNANYFASRLTSNIFSSVISCENINAISASNTSSLGLMLASRTSTTSLKVYRSNTLLGTQTALGDSVNSPYSIFIGSYNSDGVASAFSTKQCAFASIGDGLTDQDVINFYNIVQRYQINLGRQV